ncbi:xdhC and CoxI family protein [Roseovarius sp. A-2]|uniref:xanthine dehydrogenase accessory protein XdhC n=1 Tax=Roseovarius sp. A-2 TaxID=1570360 RepID=UPI0009B5061D|nr:xanthine dehydrogenase accessory protein XdhC [Roseovarius sp. A-2]GAW37066.1 xdhC and CoxI family protein [Roseovarius sp. A-2]
MVDRFERFLETEDETVLVCITSVEGSAPRECDAMMLVSSARIEGTIGGGQLEFMAIERARAMLKATERSATMTVALGPEIGQCCGGRVGLSFDVLTADSRADFLAQRAFDAETRPVVHICGAGHVGRALAGLFVQMPVRTVLIDTRDAELRLCRAPVERCLTAIPEAEIRGAEPRSAFIILTHDHALDFLLTSEALSRGDAAYVGLIGSATKRTKFERYHADQSARIGTHRLVCPIGTTGSGDKRPEVIAAFVAAEVMTALTKRPDDTNLRLLSE